MSQKSKKTIILIGDIITLYLTLWLTLLIRYQTLPSSSLILQHVIPFSILYIVWLTVFYITGLYTINVNQNNIKFFNILMESMLWNTAIGAVFFYLTPFVEISPKTNFLISIILTILLITLWRQTINRIIGSKTLLTNTLLIGENIQVEELVNELKKKPQFGYKVIQIISPSKVLNDSEFNLKKLIEQLQIKVIAIDPLALKSQIMINRLFKIIPMKLKVMNLVNFSEEVSGKIPVYTIGQTWFLENLNLYRQNSYEDMKRIFDILISSLFFISTIWLTPIIALLIKLTSKGPIFFTQSRTGLLGKTFKTIKFRSMIDDAELNGGPQWAQKNDSRATVIGKFLRKTRLDEIPQLWNILKGDMSFVGPRPERPKFVDQLNIKIPFYNERHLVKPGLSGWAQINFPYGASEQDAMEKLQYDLYYIKNRSFIFDIAILLKTIKTILSHSGT